MKRSIATGLMVAALGCGELTEQPPPLPPPPPPPPPTSFAIRPALDTALIGEYVLFVAERADSTVDQWTVSDSSFARLVPMERGRALLVARLPGTVTIKARRQRDSGQATLIIPPFAITPLLDTLTVGEQVTFQANQWPYDPIQWSSSDSGRARVTQHLQYWASVLAQAAGTVTITATHQGDTGRATLVIREPKPGEWEPIDLGLLDASVGLAFAIGDDGSVLGRLDAPGDFSRGFIYKNGAMHKLPTSGGDDQPYAIGPSGQIAGVAYDDTSRLVIWDTPDAAPRRMESMGIERVVGINERGDVLITTWFGNYKMAPHYRGVLWRNNVRVDLGDLSDSTVAFPSSYAKAWNTRGQIVGWTHVTEVKHTNNWDPTDVSHPFLWENGVMRDLGVLTLLPCTDVATPTDCSWGEATGINAQGVVVGTANGPDGGPRAFIWENGVMRDLGVAPGHFTRALAINDLGQVMGSIDGGCTTFFWENGQTQIVGPICPVGLSPNGEIIGWGHGGDGQHAFIWQAGHLTDLGPGEPRAINSRSEVAGWSGCCSYTRPMLWRKKG